jgi:hypothetical protein
MNFRVNPISLDCAQEELSKTLLGIFSDAQIISGNYFSVLVIVPIV